MKERTILIVKDFTHGVEYETRTAELKVIETYNMVDRKMKEILPTIEVRVKDNQRITLDKSLVLAYKEIGEKTVVNEGGEN